MSVEQTTQLIQLILNAVLMSVTCALVLVGLTVRHQAITLQLQGEARLQSQLGSDRLVADPMLDFTRSQLGQGRIQTRRVCYAYQISRYSMLSAYYALLFSVLSCFTLVLRGLLDWNGLISLSLGCFVIGIAALLVAVGLTLVEWHISDRTLLDEVQKLLNDRSEPTSSRQRSSRTMATKSRPGVRQPRHKMRVG